MNRETKEAILDELLTILEVNTAPHLSDCPCIAKGEALWNCDCDAQVESCDVVDMIAMRIEKLRKELKR